MASFNIRGRYLFPFESRLRVFFNHLNHLVQGCGSLKNSQIESLHKKYFYVSPWTSRASGRKTMQARFRTEAFDSNFTTVAIVNLCRHNFTQIANFVIFFVSSISYRPTDLSLLKEFSKNVTF